jgi:hypothetical protein
MREARAREGVAGTATEGDVVVLGDGDVDAVGRPVGRSSAVR